MSPTAGATSTPLTGADVRVLCRWLRSRLSEDRSPPALPPNLQELRHRPQWVLRAGLVELARRAVSRELITSLDADAWTAAEGLYSRLDPRTRVASAFGMTPRQLDSLRRRASNVVARVWDDAVFTSRVGARPNSPAVVGAPAMAARNDPQNAVASDTRYTDGAEPALALAHAHAELAALAADADDAALTAVEQIRDERLGLPPARKGALAAWQRAGRHRARPTVHARIAQEDGQPLLAPALLAAHETWTLTSPDHIRQLDAKRPDADWLADLVRRAEHADLRASRSLALTAARGYARYDRDPPDRETAALAWRLAIATDLPYRDMAALWRLQHLRRLLPADHPTALAATIDTAQALRIHGYVEPAARMLHTVLRRLRTIRLSPDTQDPLQAAAYAAFGCFTPAWVAGEGPTRIGDVIEAAERADRFLDAEREIAPEARQTHARRRLLALGLAELASASTRRPAPSHRLRSLADELRYGTATMSPHDQAMTWLTLAHLARSFGDRGAFFETLHEFAAARPLLPGYNFDRDVRGHARFARRHRWPIPDL